VPQLKIGIQLASLQLPFKKALHTAAQMGAQGIEIDARTELRPREISHTGIRQLRKMLEDLNLRVCAVRFQTRRGYHVAEDLDRRVAASKEVLRFAYALGAPVVVNQVGEIPADEESTEWGLLLQALADIGNCGQRVGSLLAADTGSEEGSDLARLIRALPTGALGINLDPGGLIVHGFSATEATRELAPYVLHVHARDGVRDLARGRGLETPLGRGSVDFPELIGTLEEQGYRGFFTIQRERSDNPIEEIHQAAQYLSRL
jgi:sugar phosphate isomerase/epimerase